MRQLPATRRRFPSWLPAVLLLALALALRVYRLGDQELRGDEAFGYFFSLRPYADIVRATLRLREPHPVASYFVQHAWLGWAGHSEYALRFISAWCGAAATALIYRLGRQLALGKRASLVGALLLAISPYAIWHSQDARMYTMSLALTLASTILAISVWRDGGRRACVAYVVVSWLALHTHYFAAFVALAQNLAWLLERVKSWRSPFELGRPAGRIGLGAPHAAWLGSQIVLALLYAPWLFAAWGALTTYPGAADSPGLVAMGYRSLSVFAVGETVPTAQRIGWAGLAAGGALVGAMSLARAGRVGQRALIVLTLYLLIPLLATWASARSRPIFNERYLIAAAPPFYLLLAAALASTTGSRSLLRRTLGLGLALALLVGVGLSLDRAYHDPAFSKTIGWRELATAMQRLAAGMPLAQTRLVDNAPDPTLWYYTGPLPHLTLPPAAQDRVGSQRAVAELAADDVRRVILARKGSAGWDASDIAPTTLAEVYTLVAEAPVRDWTVQVYVRPPATLAPVGERFAKDMILAAAAAEPLALSPGGVVAVHLRWQGEPEALAGSEKVFLHLVDGEGRLVAQDDRPLDGEIGSVRSYGIRLPSELAPGRYRLVAGLYDPGQPGAPRLLTERGQDSVVLAELIATQ